MRPEAIREGVPLARYTTMQVGGPARFLVEAPTGLDAAPLLDWARQHGLSWSVLGQGSNVIFPDRGYSGLVVVFRSSGLERRWSESPGPSAAGRVLVEAEASAPLASLARWAARQGLSGLEWAGGLPGTLGGAVAGNAGAFGACLADVIHSVDVVCPDDKARRLTASDLGLAYRRCTYLEERGPLLVTRVQVRLDSSPPADCQRRLAEVEQQRRATQPVGPSSGCIFRNPGPEAAGYLLDQCGLKGTRVGGAVISEQHANFIVNQGEATTADVLALMRVARARVWEQFGVWLQPEVRLMGGATLEDD